jgi:hypothetical protein
MDEEYDVIVLGTGLKVKFYVTNLANVIVKPQIRPE